VLPLAIVGLGALIVLTPSSVPGLTPPMSDVTGGVGRTKAVMTRRSETMTDHKIGTRDERLAARERLLVREKEHTRRGDELARQRRELPWVPVNKEFRLDTR
jgi:Bacterial protein of unknown function (DUF899)